MATTTLTAANETYNVFISMKGILAPGTASSAVKQNGNTIDAGAGTDTLSIDASYTSGYWAITSDAAGLVTFTTGSSTVYFKNFEKFAFKDGTVINLGSAVNDTINGGSLADGFLYGLGGDDTINGLGGNDTMYGGDGNDKLDGGVGSDKMYGGLGDDTFVVDVATDTVTEAVGEGTDTVQTGLASYTLGANLENLTYDNGTVTDAAFTATGNALNNVITGGTASDTYVLTGAAQFYTFTAIAGTNQTQITDSRGAGGDGTDIVIGIENIKFGTAAAVALSSLLVAPFTGTTGADSITGSTGADTMIGYAGDDTYTVNDAGDVVTEALNEGIDTVNASIDYTLAANVEKLNLTGTAISGTGNALDNTITGNASANILNGGVGADAMTGGAGDDTYTVDNAGDTVIEAAAGGTDTVNSSVDFMLGVEVEKLILMGTAINATGNALANTITGNASGNTIDGGTGADAMTGGAGNDTYIVDNAGDTVTEVAGGGTDTIQASVNFTLSAEVENLILTGAAANGTGNTLNNAITGNASANIIDGGTGADAMTGGAGNDTYIVDNAGDTVTEVAGGGTADSVQSSINYTLSAEVENLVLTGTALTGTGNALGNAITGNASANTIDGGTGADAMTGGAGDDTYYVDNAGDTVTEVAGGGSDTVSSSIDFTLGSEVEKLILTGTALNATGNALANTITGNASANTIDGGTGADAMTGGAGDDTYIVDNIGDTVTEIGGGGIDTEKSSVDFTLSAEVEKLIMLAGAVSGTGNALDNTITGNASNNTIDGGAGTGDVLVLTGNRADYTYTASDATHTQITDNRAGGDGTDIVTNIETVQFAGGVTYSIDVLRSNIISGTSGVDTLTGSAANDTLDGGLGADAMSGLAGDDIYLVDNVGDTVTENAAEGTADSVHASVDFTLSTEVENLILLAGAANGTGNTAVNTITGNDADNTLNGMGGADTLIGGNGNDTYVIGNAGVTITETATGGTADVVNASMDYTLGINVEILNLLTGAMNGTGNSGVNTITGNDAANTLNGMGGADTLIGGNGNDTYVIGNAGITVTETATGGTADVVNASIDYVLGINVEILNLTGAALKGTGNAAANTINGNAGANTLNGLVGADKMAGGLGNDIYVVDNLGDTVTEALGAGTDTVQSSVTYTLAANVENLTLAAGVTVLNGTGNALVNTIIGNSGANVLDGKVGADKMTGGLGNDTYYVDNALDVVTELVGGGTADHVKASVSYVQAAAANIEFLETANAALATVVNLTGNALANTITGNAGVNSLSGLAGNDVMSGLAGNDTLNGGLGLDTMTGGLGADKFVFNTALATTNIDKITDFNVIDTINLENSGTGLFNALALGTLATTAFWSAAGAVTAHDATDRIVYNSTTGDLFYDKDGLGGAAAIKFATLTTHPAITNADFVII
jgi:trimeric autotransporter adhesin